MLEQMRKSSQSLLIYLLFSFLIVIFIVSFGPQSRGTTCDAVVGGNDHYAAKVSGDIVSTNAFRYGFLVMGGAQAPAQIAKARRLKEMVMDKLIERELLAQEAERVGYIVTDEEVEDLLADSKMVALGEPLTVGRIQKDGKFNYEAFKKFVQFELGLNPKTFIEEQKRELLALRVRNLMRAGVKVSLDEVKADFERTGLQVNLEYLRFSNRKYEPSVTITDAERTAYASKNEAKLRELYEQKKFMYEKVPKEVRVRQILVKGGAGAADGTKAQHKAEQLAAKIKGGDAAKANASFAQIAKESSDDAASKAKGGDLGWRRKGTLNLEAADDDKVLAAKTGELLGPFKTKDGGAALLLVDGNREGDLPFDKVKMDLADEKIREERAGALAKADAEAALGKAKAGSGKSLKELFPSKSDEKTDAKSKLAKLPPADDDAAHAEETGLFSRRGSREGAIVEGLGVSNALSKAAFELKPDAPLAGPFELAGSWVVVRLKDRKEPDLADYDKKKLDLQHDAELNKWMEVLTDWSHDRCVEARDGKRIQINHDVLRYEDSSEPPPYEPCMPRRLFGG
jgi:peptidyl-prolyl cis-trans isomerase D